MPVSKPQICRALGEYPSTPGYLVTAPLNRSDSGNPVGHARKTSGFIGAEDHLFHCANPAAGAVTDPDDLLDMEVFHLQQIEARRIETVMSDRQFTLPAAMAPFRVTISDAFHVEPQDRLARYRTQAIVMGAQIELRASG